MIGQRIKQYRTQKKMSLSEMAERAGIAKSYLSSIERSIQSNPSIQILEKISSVLDIPVHFCSTEKQKMVTVHSTQIGKNLSVKQWPPEFLKKSSASF